MSWTNHRVERLKALHAEGYSMSQIAKELGGGISRNAVIGKANRLGLGFDQPSAPMQARTTKPRPKPVTTHEPRVSSISGVRYAAPVGEPRSPFVRPPFADAFKALPGSAPKPFGEPGVCKWPIDSQVLGEHLCCGQKLSDDRYCDVHVRASGGPAPTTPKQLARSLRWAS